MIRQPFLQRPHRFNQPAVQRRPTQMNRNALSADTPYLVVEELEPDGRGGQVDTMTVFLTASECPIGCSMCDLYRNTLTTATPEGAIPRQLDAALQKRLVPGETRDAARESGWLKLYNSGNFFDPRSIPPSDYRSIAERCQGFSRIVVENHPKIGAERLRTFRDLLQAPLEIAVGLETVQPRWLRRLGKQMSRDEFDHYATWIRSEKIDLRVFLIIGVPGISVTESVRWARLSARHAIANGARHVSLIPARSGHGWNGNSDQLPHFSSGDLLELQQAAILDAEGRAAITIDLWDVASSEAHFNELAEINLSQRVAL